MIDNLLNNRAQISPTIIQKAQLQHLSLTHYFDVNIQPVEEAIQHGACLVCDFM